jgi:hypothetical protein
MLIVVLGLSLSSSCGNGHATTWRALLGALAERGHDTDKWPGLDEFLAPPKEVVVARSSDDVLAALRWSEDDRLRLADAGRNGCLPNTPRDTAPRASRPISPPTLARAHSAGRRSAGHAETGRSSPPLTRGPKHVMPAQTGIP